MLVLAGLNQKVVFTVGSVTELLLMDLDSGAEYTLPISEEQAAHVLRIVEEAGALAGSSGLDMGGAQEAGLASSAETPAANSMK